MHPEAPLHRDSGDTRDPGMGLDALQRALVADYWFSRAEGEMTSYIGFQHVLADLRAENTPQAILALAERAVEDEHRHALFCRDWAVRFGHPGGEVVPRSTEPIRFRGATERENRLLRILLCCFTETTGCFVLRHVRRVMVDPELRRNNQRHLADELQHSRVGWGHLSTLSPRDRALLRAWTPAVLSLLPEACCEGPEEEREELVPYGYFTPRLLRAALDEALADVIQPGLLHLGLREAS
ncbi:MAG TPA: hypothetical protein VGK73_40540 [Polyangiaceae bacterium]